MKHVLVVIDIQPEFRCSFSNKTIKNIQREIKKAIRNKDHIFFVEYEGCGKTDKRLRDAASGYKKVSTITKFENDGSRQILKYLKIKKLSDKSLKICGVNTDACVEATVEGINGKLLDSKKRMAMKIVADACSSELESGHKKALIRMRKLKHVTKVL